MKNFDANPAQAISFLQQQGAYLETEMFKAQYPELKYKQFVDIDNKAPAWTNTVVTRGSDVAGKMKPLGVSGTDIATADVGYKQENLPITTFALGYNYTIQEIGFAMMMGENLDASKAVAVREVTERDLNQVYLNGDDSLGITGVFDNAQVPTSTAGSTIAAAIASGDAKNVIDIFSAAYNAVYFSQTNTTHKPSVFGVPTQQYLLLSQNFCNFGNASNISFLQALQIAFPDMTFIDDINLVGIGAGETDRLVCYKKSTQVLKGYEPMYLEWQPIATADNVTFRRASITRSGGVYWATPAAGHYVDGV